MRSPRRPSTRSCRAHRGWTRRCWPPCWRDARPPAILPLCWRSPPTGRRADALGAAIESLVPGATVLSFPAWETLPHERLSPSPETVGRRLTTLRALAAWNGDHPIVVTASVRAAVQPIAPGLADISSIDLRVGERACDLDELVGGLVERAYSRVDMVSRRGEFAVRGGIVDVFPPVADHPYRIELFGDEVDQIRAFSVADQRSLPGDIGGVELVPSRELLLTDDVRERALELQDSMPGIAQMLEKMANGIPVEGMESLSPVVAGPLVSLPAYLPPAASVALVDPERAITRALTLGETNREFLEAAWAVATGGGDAPVDLDAGDFLPISRLRDDVRSAGGVWWSLSPFDAGIAEISAELAEAGEDVVPDGGATRVRADAVPSFQGNVEGATERIAGRLRDGWAVVVAAEGAGLVERARDVLSERGQAARIVDELTDAPEPGVATLVRASLERGFESAEARLSVLTENEFYGRAIGGTNLGAKKLASRRRNVVDPLQLKKGDYVVHATHGIGRFVEMVKREGLDRREERGQERARVPCSRIRAQQARPPRRQAARSHRSARSALEVRRR